MSENDNINKIMQEEEERKAQEEERARKEKQQKEKEEEERKQREKEAEEERKQEEEKKREGKLSSLCRSLICLILFLYCKRDGKEQEEDRYRNDALLPATPRANRAGE